MRRERWATFDCYGTLVDWNAGIGGELGRLFGAAQAPPFEGAIVASEIGSYKPAHRHWEAFYEAHPAARGRHVHVAQSHAHDIVATAELDELVP